VATKDSRSNDAGSHRIRPPITAAAILIGIYIATYFAVWVVIARVLTPPDAAAAIPPDSSMASSAAATASTSPAGVGELPLSDSLRQAPEQTDNSRECAPSSGIDSKCIFN
jgi:hypothetical protein